MNNDDTTIDLRTFVETIFTDLEPGETPLLARPSTKGFAQFAPAERHYNRAVGEMYLCGASVRLQQPLRRRKRDITAVHAILADDVGTKAEMPPVPFSILQETSANNLQGLWLIHPEEDLELVDAAYRALAEAGYTDAGAVGVARVFRVPGSINTKPGRDNFATRIVEWHPERVWDLRELLAELGLEPIYKKMTEADFDGEIPPDVRDEVVTWLSAAGRLGELDEFGFKIRCPWCHEHTGGDNTAGYSPLGHGELPLYRVFHCFHEHCAHRSARDFLAWVAEQGGPSVDVSGVREINAERLRQYLGDITARDRIQLLRDSLPAVRRANLPDLDVTQNGNPSKAQPVTGPNVERVAELLGVRVRRNMQQHVVECEFIEPELNELVDHVHEEAHLALLDACEKVGMRGSGAIADRINLVSGRERYSPVVDWMRSKPWDGIDRFEALACTVTTELGQEAQFRAYLRRWTLQTVQAVHNWEGDPKAIEHVLVLSGPQGCGKTTWLASLMPEEYFTRGVYLNLGRGGAAGDRDAIRKATATPIVELGELETTFSKSEVGHQKNFFSQTMDTYRMAYGASEVSFPRTTSFAATVNADDFLIDVTGSRRYWCTLVLRCDAFHDVDMQQLWAQATQLWRSGEQFHLTAEEEAVRLKMASGFEFQTPVDELVAQYLARHNHSTEQPMNASSFLVERLRMAPNNHNKALVKAALTRHLGKPFPKKGGVRRAWVIPMTDHVTPRPYLRLADDSNTEADDS